MLTSPPKEIVLVRLWDELIVRNRFTVVPQLLLTLISISLCYRMHLEQIWSALPYLFILLGSLGRHFSLCLRPKNTIPRYPVAIFYYTSIALMGLAWSYLVIKVQSFYGPVSSHGIYCYFLIAGQCGGGVATFSARPLGYLFLMLPLTITGGLAPFYFDLPDAFVILGFMVFMTLFYFYQIRLAHLYIRNSVEHEVALTTERDKLQSLINTVPGFVSFIDNDLYYRAVNDFGKSFYKDVDLIGKKVGFLHPNSQFSHFVQDFMNSSKETNIGEVDINFDGPVKSFIVSIKRTGQPQGGAVIVSVPMDELVEARENLRVQEAKSHYTAKLASLGEMAAGIAHEINNPLAIIQGSSDQMAKIMVRPELEVTKLLEYNSKIQKTVDRISKIIKSLKGLSRNGVNDPFLHFHFHTVLEPCVEISRQRFRDNNVELEIAPYDPELEFLGREIEIAQVLMNLINNAFDAAMLGETPRKVKLDIQEHSTYIDIRIEDSGPGIPNEIKDKIMEPFFTTKPINQGTGLGLSISKTIMEYHGGALILDESVPSTTFIMRFKR